MSDTSRGTKRKAGEGNTTNLCAVLTGIKKIETLTRNIAPPLPNEVTVDIKAIGICGSDLAYWSTGVAGRVPFIDS